MNTMTHVIAAECKKCGDRVYSRARHDFRSCSCGAIFIDGGLDYTRVGGKSIPTTTKLLVPATKEQLYSDWNFRLDKYGLIKGNKHAKIKKNNKNS